MADIATQKLELEKAIKALRKANNHLKKSNGADQLCTGLVLDSLNYDEMIKHLVEGISLLLASYDEEEK